jgi:hypothetical protein
MSPPTPCDLGDSVGAMRTPQEVVDALYPDPQIQQLSQKLNWASMSQKESADAFN